MKPLLNSTADTLTYGYNTLHNVVNDIVIKPVNTTVTCITNIGTTIINYPLQILSTTTSALKSISISNQNLIPITDANTNTNINTISSLPLQTDNDIDNNTNTNVNVNVNNIDQLSSGNVTPEELDANELTSDELDTYIREATIHFTIDDNYWPLLHESD